MHLVHVLILIPVTLSDAHNYKCFLIASCMCMMLFMSMSMMMFLCPKIPKMQVRESHDLPDHFLVVHGL